MGLFNISLFIYGPKYSVENKEKTIILNFLYGMVKLAIWCTRKKKVEERGCIDPILLTKCFVKKKANGMLFIALHIIFSLFFIFGVLIIFSVNLMGMEALI